MPHQTTRLQHDTASQLLAIAGALKVAILQATEIARSPASDDPDVEAAREFAAHMAACCEDLQESLRDPIAVLIGTPPDEPVH